jgi:hypothetical protein
VDGIDQIVGSVELYPFNVEGVGLPRPLMLSSVLEAA